MKLYRVSIDYFNNDYLLSHSNSTEFLYESVYYPLGYTSFHISGKRNNMISGYNSFLSTREIKTDGKYLFVFPGDAFVRSLCIVLGQAGPHFVPSVTIMEYDIPFEIATEHLGYGNYYPDRDVPEVYVEKRHFGNDSRLSTDLDLETKIQAMKDHIDRSIEVNLKYHKYAQQELTKAMEMALYSIEHDNVELIKSGLTTGRSWTVSFYCDKHDILYTPVFDKQIKRLTEEGLFTSPREADGPAYDIVRHIKNHDVDEARRVLKRLNPNE